MLSKRNIEKFYPLILTIVGTIVIITLMHHITFFENLKEGMIKPDFLSLIVTVETTLFGFLLAIFAIILQMDNKIMELIKQNNRFTELIGYSKQSVLSCFLVIVFTSNIILFNDLIINNTFTEISFILWITSILYNFLCTYRFVHIFYNITKSS